MADSFDTLGQSTPAATTLTDVYTVPSSTEAVISAVYICNRSSTATTFRISIAPGGAADANTHYTHYDVALAGNDTFQVGPFAMQATDVLRVYVGAATVTVNVHGLEIT